MVPPTTACDVLPSAITSAVAGSMAVAFAAKAPAAIASHMRGPNCRTIATAKPAAGHIGDTGWYVVASAIPSSAARK
jgi:hypothetical protein